MTQSPRSIAPSSVPDCLQAVWACHRDLGTSATSLETDARRCSLFWQMDHDWPHSLHFVQAFCWLCGHATGYTHTWTEIAQHSCGRYKEEADKKIDQAQRNNKRYQHYCLRWWVCLSPVIISARHLHWEMALLRSCIFISNTVQRNSNRYQHREWCFACPCCALRLNCTGRCSTFALRLCIQLTNRNAATSALPASAAALVGYLSLSGLREQCEPPHAPLLCIYSACTWARMLCLCIQSRPWPPP